jgi:hypothetical protein
LEGHWDSPNWGYKVEEEAKKPENPHTFYRVQASTETPGVDHRGSWGAKGRVGGVRGPKIGSRFSGGKGGGGGFTPFFPILPFLPPIFPFSLLSLSPVGLGIVREHTTF